MNEVICQACGKPITWGSEVIAIRYGEISVNIGRTSHVGVTNQSSDYFHKQCAGKVAIRQEE